MRARLAERLPGYLVPARVQRLERLPVLEDRKLDRRALTELAARLPTAGEPAPPETALSEPALSDTEATVARILREIIGVHWIATDVSFFRQGGNSLSAAQLCSRISRDLGVRLRVSQCVRGADRARRCRADHRRKAVGRKPMSVQPAEDMTTQMRVLWTLGELGDPLALLLRGPEDPYPLYERIRAKGPLHAANSGRGRRWTTRRPRRCCGIAGSGAQVRRHPDQPGDHDVRQLDSGPTAPTTRGCGSWPRRS